jgi:hypothetical protein
LTSGIPKTALSTAMRMSQAAAISQRQAVDPGDRRHRDGAYASAAPVQAGDEPAAIFGGCQGAHFPDVGAANESLVAGAGEHKRT